MSSTNKTTNYELSQFIGSDKPAWLSDYNGDMGKIDAGIKTAQTTATGADGKADANTTKIGTLASLNTTAKTDLVSAINEVDANTDTNTSAINGVGITANAAKTTADGLSAYFTLSDMGGITATTSNGTINASATHMYYAFNAAGTYGKIYGQIRWTASSATETTITLDLPKLNASGNFTMACCCYNTVVAGGNYTIINSRDIVINATAKKATITIPAVALASGAVATLYFPACVYYFTDFGDTPTPE